MLYEYHGISDTNHLNLDKSKLPSNFRFSESNSKSGYIPKLTNWPLKNGWKIEPVIACWASSRYDEKTESWRTVMRPSFMRFEEVTEREFEYHQIAEKADAKDWYKA